MTSDPDDYWTALTQAPVIYADPKIAPISIDLRKALRSDDLNCPLPLNDILFGEARAAKHCYLLIDPTLRKNVSGLFDLDCVDVPVSCLFTGEAAVEMEEVAPYLLDLTQLAAPALFHRDFFDRHWGAGTGVLVMSDTGMDGIKRHFRKFTKLRRTSDGNWYFFRFWDPAIAGVHLRTIYSNETKIAQWFGRGLIQSIIVEENQGETATIFHAAAAQSLSTNTHLPAVVLDDWELEPFRKTALDKDILKTATLLKSDFSTELKSHTPETISRIIRPAVERFMGFGFKRREHLHVIAAWALFYGPEFDRKDPDGQLQSICASLAPERERFNGLKQRMNQFAEPEVRA